MRLKSEKFDMMANVSKMSWASRINLFTRLFIQKTLRKFWPLNQIIDLFWIEDLNLPDFILQISMQLLDDKYDTVSIVKFLH